MKIIKLGDIQNLIEEVSSEYMEMAYKPKGTQSKRIDPETGKEIIPKARGFWKDDNSSEIPDYWILNPMQQEGEDKLVVPLDCNELENFIEENRDWLDSINASHGLDPLLVACNRTKYHPRNIKVGTSYQWSGERMSLKERLKRILHSDIVNELGDEQVSKKLELSSVPEIKARDKKHLNRYGRMDNDKIVYGTHTFNSYVSSKQFLRFVTARITGKQLEDDFKSYHLARQFNTIYRKWSETKKNDKQYVGKTDAYMLERFGFDPDNLDVTVRTDLRIEGVNNRQDKKYTWTVKLETKFGRKLTDDARLGSLDLDKEITIGPKEFEYSLPQNEEGVEQEFSDTYTVLDNFEIHNGLIECLNDMKERILAEFKPIQALKLANIKNFDITKKTDAEI